MNYIILDIIDDLDLSTELKDEISNLLNWHQIHSSKHLTLYTLGHDSFNCIFNTAISTYQEIHEILFSSDLRFKSQDCVLRPVLKACLNSLQVTGTVLYISNNIRRWSVDMQSRCKPFFLTSAPEGYFSTKPETLLKEIFDSIISIQLSGTLLISNESKVENGQSFEIGITLKPVTIPLQKLTNWKVELLLESLVKSQSVGLEYLHGSSWVVTSPLSEFFSLCRDLADKKLFMICSSETNLDDFSQNGLPLFYAVIPALECFNHMLIKRVASKEFIRNISLPPVCFTEDDKNLSEFIMGNYDILQFSPKLCNSGLHQFLRSSLENLKKDADPNSGRQEKSLLFGFMKDSLKKKRGRKPRF